MRKKGSMQVYSKITSILVILLMVFSTGFSSLPVGVLEEETPAPAETPTPTEETAVTEEPAPTDPSENIAPAITLLEPAGDVSVTQGELLRIAWQDEDPDDNSLISLAFDLDEDPLNNEGHTWIVQDLEEDLDEAEDAYEWDTTDIPEGEYYLWAEIVDGTNSAAYSLALGKVTIQESAPTEEPTLEPTEEPTLEPTPTEKSKKEDNLKKDVIFINGPPEPSTGFRPKRVDMSSSDFLEKIRSGAAATLTVPAFRWSFGCSATSAAMIAGYYDRIGFPNMYTGPTNGGVMPLDNSSWPTWVDSGGDTRHQCPLSATHNGLDGRTTNGHVDDYWIEVDAAGPDPYVGNWTEHAWGDCTADYMRTSIWEHGYVNSDGGTTFNGYASAIKRDCSTISDDDGTLGLKNFYESRGYTVSECYRQKTDNQYTGGFSFADYKAEIDAGHPVMFSVTGHTMVGVGYEDPDTVILHNTWDYLNDTMTWGGSYDGRTMHSVSIVHPTSGTTDDNYEPNNTFGTAYDLRSDEGVWLSTVDGYGKQFDEDWYQIYVNEHVTIDLQFSHSEGDIDMNLYDSTGTNGLVSSTSSDDNEYIDFDVPSAGNYYIRLYYDNAGNTYDLKWDDVISDRTLTVTKTGTGTGTVTSSPAGINCGSTCSADFSWGDSVELFHSADSGSTFTGWSGACSGTGSCVVSMTMDRSVTAEFTAGPTDDNYEPNNTFDTAYDLSTDEQDWLSTIDGYGKQFDHDWYEIYVSSGYERVLVDLQFTHSSGDIDVNLYDSTGSNGLVSSTTSTDNEYIDYVVPSGGTYYIRVYYSDVGNSYDLWWDDIIPTPTDYTLTVSKSGSGSGTVTSSPAGIDCGGDCSELYSDGTSVELFASADSGSTFTGWSGACSGIGSCVVSMTTARSVTANFDLQTHDLTVYKGGTGIGTVTSSPAGIDCGSDCSETYDYGISVTLTAIADTGSTFTGWSGACSGTGTCVVSMTTDRSVTANFVVQTHDLTVYKGGTGIGTVTSSPAGIDCGSDCSETYDYGISVTLTAIADTGSTFTGWSGACSGTGSCVVSMTADRSVTANYDVQTHDLTVYKGGTGIGTVTSSPAGINCGSDCSETYDYGTTVPLTATPASGSTFTGWSGACSGTGSCLVSMTTDRSVTAEFTAGPTDDNYEPNNTFGTAYDLSTDEQTWLSTIDGLGKQFDYDWYEIDVTTGYERVLIDLQFTHSAGDIDVNLYDSSGTNGLVSSTTSTDNEYIDFVVPSGGTYYIRVYYSDVGNSYDLWWDDIIPPPTDHTLTVSKTGTGSGTVTSIPAGIDCGSDCSEIYSDGTSVELFVSADPDSTFTGWSGACSGTGSCVVSMTTDRSVTANFDVQTHNLSVSKSGTGAGTVTSSPAGINCGGDCSEAYTYGTSVELFHSADSGSTFTGWSGACSGTGSCVVSMTTDRSATAAFTAGPTSSTTTITSDSPDPSDVGESYSVAVTVSGSSSTSKDTSDGSDASVMIIDGPPEPPAGYKREVINLSSSDLLDKVRSGAAATLTVPAFNWSFGCSATSAAMIAGYFDRNGLSDMYTGPTDGGVMPLDNSSWPDWVDSGGDTRHQCPLSATHNGLDGRTTTGHVDDYWIEYGAGGPDPYVGNWTEHTWGDCTADYMRTNIWEHGYESTDGSTWFWFNDNNTTLPCSSLPDGDGTLGLKNFYESRGYAVSDCYMQMTDNQHTGAFSFTDYKAEIDAGFPVMFHVTGHTMVGVGYSDPDTVILHDTWDYSDHTMTWGSDYSGMDMWGVSIVHPTSGSSTPTGTVDINDGSGASCTATLSSGSGSCSLTSTTDGAKTLTANYSGDSTYNSSSDTESHIVNPPDDDDNYEPNNTLETAYDLSSFEGVWLSSIDGLGKQFDDDWYEIYVTPGDERVLVDVTFTHSAGDIDVSLYNSSGGGLVSATSTTDDEYIDYIVPSGGTYYIRVYYGNAGNAYDLWWDDYAPPSHILTVSKTGAGSGSVTSVPSGIDCGSDCSETYSYGTSVTLTASADTGSTFTGWSGDCSGTGTCVVSMTADRSVTATFTLDAPDPPEMDVKCEATGTSIPDGDTSPTTSKCTDFGSLDIDSTSDTHRLRVWNTGVGDLVLSGDPRVAVSGANASDFTITLQPASPIGGGSNSAQFDVAFDPSGEGLRTATLSIQNNDPDENPYTFAVQGTGISTDDDNYEENDTLETAFDLSTDEQTWLSTINGFGKQFDDDWYEIYVTPGYERVQIDLQFTHSEGDIDVVLFNSSGTLLDVSASVTDNESIDYIVPSGGTYYILVTYADAGNAYDLWWDDIVPPSHTLTVSKAGTGTGTVTSSPAGIDCGSDCTEIYTDGTSVTLTASADTGSTFTGWSGACTGTGSCVVSMTADRSVTAAFTAGIPGAQTIKPRGTIQDHTPEYKWTRISGATKYQFQVIKRGGDVLIDKVDKSPSCDATACYNTPNYWLKDSPYKWRVRSYTGGVWSAYSAYKRFYISNPFTALFNGSKDDFRDKAGSWGTTSTALYTYGVTDQASSIYHKGSIYDDFTYTAKVQREDDLTSANYLAVRTGIKLLPADNTLYWSYMFGYTNNGFYSVWGVDKEGLIYELQPWTESSTIVDRGWNTLKVTASDTTFKFYINGTKVVVINNPTPTLNKGYVAFETYKVSGDSPTSRFMVDYATLTMPLASAAADTDLVSAEQEALNQAALRAGVTGSIEGYFVE